jgi:DNA-binding response OmpR family regulator
MQITVIGATLSARARRTRPGPLFARRALPAAGLTTCDGRALAESGGDWAGARRSGTPVARRVHTFPPQTGTSMRILVIEDNQDIAANIGDYLEERGHTVDFAADGVTGLHLAVVHDFDAVVLDLNLPGMDGLEVCRKLRNEARKQTPVLMLTARDTLDNKLAGFDSGADDYLVKPFALQEVEVRLNALARRGKGVQTRVLTAGDLEYNLDTLEVRREGRLLQLNPTALKILQALMEAAPAVVTRQELETRVWGEELPDSDSLRVHIHGLRQVVDKPFEVPMIQTRHGIGYRIALPDGGN